MMICLKSIFFIKLMMSSICKYLFSFLYLPRLENQTSECLLILQGNNNYHRNINHNSWLALNEAWLRRLQDQWDATACKNTKYIWTKTPQLDNHSCSWKAMYVCMYVETLQSLYFSTTAMPPESFASACCSRTGAHYGGASCMSSSR